MAVIYIAASLLKWFRNGRFASEAAARRAADIIVFKGGDDRHGHRNMYKIPRSDLKLPSATTHYHLQYNTAPGYGYS
jgi:hypothetical protein